MIYALSVLLARPPAALKEELSATPGSVPRAASPGSGRPASDLLKRRPDVQQQGIREPLCLPVCDSNRLTTRRAPLINRESK